MKKMTFLFLISFFISAQVSAQANKVKRGVASDKLIIDAIESWKKLERCQQEKSVDTVLDCTSPSFSSKLNKRKIRIYSAWFFMGIPGVNHRQCNHQDLQLFPEMVPGDIDICFDFKLIDNNKVGVVQFEIEEMKPRIIKFFY